MAKFLVIDIQHTFCKPTGDMLPIPSALDDMQRLSRLIQQTDLVLTGISLHLLPELAPLFWERIINVPRLTYTPNVWPPHAMQGTPSNELNG